MLRLTLVRHASTAWNEARRYQGWGDPPLSARGRDEALTLQQTLHGESFDDARAYYQRYVASNAPDVRPELQTDARNKLQQLR